MESEMLMGTSLKNKNLKKAHFELKPKERTNQSFENLQEAHFRLESEHEKRT